LVGNTELDSSISSNDFDLILLGKGKIPNEVDLTIYDAGLTPSSQLLVELHEKGNNLVSFNVKEEKEKGAQGNAENGQQKPTETASSIGGGRKIPKWLLKSLPSTKK
jgi:hypothetical protein